MRVLYNPTTKKSIELTPDRLKMYQRLLRLEHDNADGLSHILRILAGVKEPSVPAYEKDIQQGDKTPDGSTVNLQGIRPEEKPRLGDNCIVM